MQLSMAFGRLPNTVGDDYVYKRPMQGLASLSSTRQKTRRETKLTKCLDCPAQIKTIAGSGKIKLRCKICSEVHRQAVSAERNRSTR